MVKLYFLFIICIFGTFSFAEDFKTLPSHLQKAYVIQKDALVYTRSDFDSIQISRVPSGTLVTISKKIYRPRSRFGTFYRIYITMPKKLRAYISEIDVVPRYVKSGSKLKINPSFDQVKKKLKYVKDFQFNTGPEDALDFSEKPLSQMKFIGMLISYSWLAYESEDQFFPAWFFSLKLSGAGLPIKQVITDINLSFSFSPPIIDKKKLKKGYTLQGDFLFKVPLIEAPYFLFHLSGGLMVKLKGALAPEDPAFSEVGAGIVGSVGLTLKIQERLAFLTEGKMYYDLSEGKSVPAVFGGLLVTF